MSLSEIERFAGALKSDAALRAEAEKVQTDGLGAACRCRGVCSK
jgi:hypothetical protein